MELDILVESFVEAVTVVKSIALFRDESIKMSLSFDNYATLPQKGLSIAFKLAYNYLKKESFLMSKDSVSE